MDLEIWACPVCYSELVERDSEVSCRSEVRSFRRKDGLPVLVRPEQEGLLRDAERLSSAWKRTKWAVPREEVLQLPFVSRPGWKQKAQSFRALRAILGSPRERTVLDVGAGTGWLSHRLVETGFRCFATDISLDSDVGLGASVQFDETPYSFERAIATLDRWPIRSRSIDIAICNASLHYLADIGVAIAEAARVLRAGGIFVIMNSPVHGDSVSAHRASLNFQERLRRLGARGQLVENHQHFVMSELERRLRVRFVEVVPHELREGFWFATSRAVKGALVGLELAAFPLYEARIPR